MKKTLTTLAICVAALAFHAANVTLEWDAPAGNFQITSYGIWWSTNVTGPWQKITNRFVDPTNYAPTTNIVIDMPVGTHFFFATASNFWGESEPSNIANTPPKAAASQKLKITR